MEFRKLYRFSRHQVAEKGAQMFWRNKYNNFKDYALDFAEYIKDKEELTLNCYIEIIDPDEFANAVAGEEMEEDMDKSWVIDEAYRDKLNGMKHGDHVYWYENFGKHDRFTLLIGYYHGVYNIFLLQLFPNVRSRTLRDDIMVTEIESVLLRINDIEYSRTENVRLDQEDDICLCGKIGGHVWANGDLMNVRIKRIQ